MLGPSSSGKSVLMKALTGRLPSVHCTGEVSASTPVPAEIHRGASVGTTCLPYPPVLTGSIELFMPHDQARA